MKKLVSILIISSFSLIGCHPLFCIWNSGYEIIKNSDSPRLEGLYELDKHSLDQMKYEGKYKITHHTLEIFADSTYKFTNLPDWFSSPFGESTQTLMNKKGHWKSIYFDSDGYRVDFDNFENPNYGVVKTKNNRLAILINIGDPDGCVGLVYVKVK